MNLRRPALFQSVCLSALIGLAGLIASPARALATPATFPFTPGFNAPPIARTATTVLLLWDRFGGEPTANYEILSGGAVIAHTDKLSHLVTGLAPGRTHRFIVRALAPDGKLLAESPALEAATKPAGVTLNVQERGAAGDGQKHDTEAIQRTIDNCPAGGTVLVPAGTYLVDHLELKADLTVELAKGATLRFLGRGAGHYPERKITLEGPDGPIDIAYGSLITGVRTDNVSIIGEGTIQANGESWWPQAIQQRHLPDDRPKVIEVIAARNLLIQGITIEDPPFWNTHPLYVDGVVVANVSFVRRAPEKSRNADGLDLDSCRDALVVGCLFANQDDSVALKCGKLEGAVTKRQRSVERVVIRDCLFDRTRGPMANPLGIAIGSETCGQVRHVWVKDCVFRGVASIINLKTNRDRRHALVEDVLVENCSYTNDHFADEPWNRAPIALDAFYFRRPDNPDEAQPGGAPDAPFFRNIRFRNITIDNPLGYAVYITGLAERPLQNVTFTNVTAKAKAGFFARNIDGLTLDRVSVTAAEGPAMVQGINVTNLRVIDGQTPPSNRSSR